MVGTLLFYKHLQPTGVTRGIVAEARPADDEARRGWRSGQNCSALQADKQFWEPQEGLCRFKSIGFEVGAVVNRCPVDIESRE